MGSGSKRQRDSAEVAKASSRSRRKTHETTSQADEGSVHSPRPLGRAAAGSRQVNLTDSDSQGHNSEENTAKSSSRSEARKTSESSSSDDDDVPPPQEFATLAAGEGDLATLINAVNTNTATSREMLVVLRSISKGVKAQTKALQATTASAEGSRAARAAKPGTLTASQVKDMLGVAQQLFYTNPYPQHHEIAAAVRCRLGAESDTAAVTLAGGHANYTALLTTVQKKMTSTVRYNAAVSLKTNFNDFYRDRVTRHGKWRASKAEKLLEDDKYRATSAAEPYGNLLFQGVLDTSFPGIKPRDARPGSTITYLGRGHVAFADMIVRSCKHPVLISFKQVWWLLQGHVHIPKSSDPAYAKFDKRWMETLEATRAMPDTRHVRFAAAP